MKCSHIWWDPCENHKLPPYCRLHIQKYGSLALPFLALSLATIFMLLSSGHDIMNLFTNNFHRAFRRFYRTTCFLNFGAINFFFSELFFYKCDLLFKQCRIMKTWLLLSSLSNSKITSNRNSRDYDNYTKKERKTQGQTRTKIS